MTNQQPRLDAAETRRSWPKVLLVFLLACALAAGIWIVGQSFNRTSSTSDAGLGTTPTSQPEPTASNSPTASASPSASPGASKSATASTPPVTTKTLDPIAKPTATAKEPALSEDAALAAVPQPIAAPVPLEKAATVGSGLSVKVVGITAVQGTAEGIGEIAGPALQFSVEVANNSAQELPADSISLTLEYGKNNTPAAKLSGPGASDFPAVIAKDKSASGTFVFNVPVDERQQVRILVSLNASTPIAAFEGAVPVSKGTP